MNFPSIKDNPIFYLGILITIEQAIGQGSVSLTHLVPVSWAPTIQGWCTLLAFVGTAIMTALAAPGRVPAAVAKVVIWFAIGGLTLTLMTSAAVAQDRGAGARIHLPIPLPTPLAPALTSATTTPGEGPLGQALANALSAPFQQLADFFNGDLDGAIKLSTQIPALQDGNGQQCWMAMKQFGDVVKLHPLPLTGKAITDLEAARLMAMAANNLCHVQQCTQVFADLANAVTVATQKIPGAGAVTVPSLNSLCSAVPVVVVAPPVSAAAATPINSITTTNAPLVAPSAPATTTPANP